MGSIIFNCHFSENILLMQLFWNIIPLLAHFGILLILYIQDGWKAKESTVFQKHKLSDAIFYSCKIKIYQIAIFKQLVQNKNH